MTNKFIRGINLFHIDFFLINIKSLNLHLIFSEKAHFIGNDGICKAKILARLYILHENLLIQTVFEKTQRMQILDGT